MGTAAKMCKNLKYDLKLLITLTMRLEAANSIKYET